MEDSSWENEVQPNLLKLSKNITGLPEILIQLEEQSIISTSEHEIIKKEKTKVERNYELLSTLKQKHWPTVKDAFIQILRETSNQYCVSILMASSKCIQPAEVVPPTTENKETKTSPVKNVSSYASRNEGRKTNKIEVESSSASSTKDPVTIPEEAAPSTLQSPEIKGPKKIQARGSTPSSNTNLRKNPATKVPLPNSNESKQPRATVAELPSKSANTHEVSKPNRVQSVPISPNKRNIVNPEKVVCPALNSTKAKTCSSNSEKLISLSQSNQAPKKITNEIGQSASCGTTGDARASSVKSVKKSECTTLELSIGDCNSILQGRELSKKDLCNSTIKASEPDLPDDEGTWKEKFLKQNAGMGIDDKSCDKRLWSACQEKDFEYRQEYSSISVKYADGEIKLKNIKDFKIHSLFQSIEALVKVVSFKPPRFLHFAAREVDDTTFQSFLSKCQMLSHLILELPKPTIVSIELSKLTHLKFLSLTNSRLSAKSSDVCSIMGTLKLSNCELGANMENEFLNLFPCVSRLEIGKMTKLTTRKHIENRNFLSDKPFKSLFQQPSEND